MMDLYTAATPNGHQVSIVFDKKEETTVQTLQALPIQ
jgi:hypothetical protein